MEQADSLLHEIVLIILTNSPNVLTITVLASLVLLREEQADDLFLAWLQAWKNRTFRLRCCLFFYLALLFSVTLLTRSYQPNPFLNIKGKLFLRYRSGAWHHGNIENIILFLPLCPLVLVNCKDFRKGGAVKTLRRCILLSAGMTILIETMQAILHLGTFQLSDLLFNLIGGIAGALLSAVYRCVTYLLQVMTQRKNANKK